jgi:hypothetical protein
MREATPHARKHVLRMLSATNVGSHAAMERAAGLGNSQRAALALQRPDVAPPTAGTPAALVHASLAIADALFRRKYVGHDEEISSVLRLVCEGPGRSRADIAGALAAAFSNLRVGAAVQQGGTMAPAAPEVVLLATAMLRWSTDDSPGADCPLRLGAECADSAAAARIYLRGAGEHAGRKMVGAIVRMVRTGKPMENLRSLLGSVCSRFRCPTGREAQVRAMLQSMRDLSTKMYWGVRSSMSRCRCMQPRRRCPRLPSLAPDARTV